MQQESRTFTALPFKRTLFCRHQYDPLAGPENELEMGDVTADPNMKKMVMEHRSRQIKTWE